MKKVFIIVSIVFAAACSQQQNNEVDGTTTKAEQREVTTKAKKSLLDIIKGQWVTSHFVKDGIQTPVPQQYSIQFLNDSLYQVIGLNKGGEWYLNNDTLVVVAEITDKYLVLEVNDSIMHTKGLGKDTADFFFTKADSK